MIKIKEALKKIRQTLTTHDWVWSILGAIAIFVYHGQFQEKYLGDPSWDAQYISKAFLVMAVVLVFHGTITGFLTLNHFHSLTRYETNNFDYEKIPEWLKFIYIPALYFFMLAALIVLFMVI